MARLISLLILLAACALAQTVEGSVSDASTGAGVPGVKVELLKGGTAFYEATTDGGGRFVFDGVKEGDYAARYRSPDYWLTAGSSDYRLFHVGGDSPTKLDARLMPWSTISGRVVDRAGNPVAKAQLELTGSGMMVNGRTYLRTSWGGGGGGALSESPLAMTFRGESDAHGKFTVQVMPGSYGLSVRPPPDLQPPDREKDGPPLLWKHTWYPGTALPEAASKILVLPGVSVSDVEVKLVAVPARMVRGVVFNPDGTPAGKVAVALGESFFGATKAESRADGTFEIPAVAEGQWRLSAEAQKSSVKLRATQWIEVARHDLENVQLHLAPPLTLQGKVLVEVPKDTPIRKTVPGPMILSMLGGHHREDELAPGGNVIVEPGANGEILVQDAYPGLYGLGQSLQPPPSPYYLDAFRIGGTDIIMQDVEIAADSEITIVYKTDGGRVLGTAEKCGLGGVLLIPRDPSLRGRGFSRSGPCDSSDHYEVQTLRPGEYYALAFAGNGPVVTVDETLLNQAVKVTVKAGEASTADLRAVTRPIF